MLIKSQTVCARTRLRLMVTVSRKHDEKVFRWFRTRRDGVDSCRGLNCIVVLRLRPGVFLGSGAFLLAGWANPVEFLIQRAFSAMSSLIKTFSTRLASLLQMFRVQWRPYTQLAPSLVRCAPCGRVIFLAGLASLSWVASLSRLEPSFRHQLQRSAK